MSAELTSFVVPRFVSGKDEARLLLGLGVSNCDYCSPVRQHAAQLVRCLPAIAIRGLMDGNVATRSLLAVVVGLTTIFIFLQRARGTAPKCFFLERDSVVETFRTSVTVALLQSTRLVSGLFSVRAEIACASFLLRIFSPRHSPGVETRSV